MKLADQLKQVQSNQSVYRPVNQHFYQWKNHLTICWSKLKSLKDLQQDHQVDKSMNQNERLVLKISTDCFQRCAEFGCCYYGNSIKLHNPLGKLFGWNKDVVR